MPTNLYLLVLHPSAALKITPHLRRVFLEQLKAQAGVHHRHSERETETPGFRYHVAPVSVQPVHTGQTFWRKSEPPSPFIQQRYHTGMVCERGTFIAAE